MRGRGCLPAGSQMVACDERPFPLGGAWLSGALACCEEVEAASSFRLRASRGRDRHPVSELGASSQRSPVRPLVAQTRRYEDLPVAAGVRLLLRVPRDAAAASGAPGDELCGRRHPGVQQTKHGALHACSHIDGAGGQLRQSSSDRLCRPGTGSPAAACLTFARGDGQSA